MKEPSPCLNLIILVVSLSIYTFLMLGFFVLHIVISAIAVINETIDQGDHQSTLHALQANAAKLSSIAPDNSQLYQKLLLSQKITKAQVRMIEGHYGSINLNQTSTETEAVFTHNQREKYNII